MAAKNFIFQLLPSRPLSRVFFTSESLLSTGRKPISESVQKWWPATMLVNCTSPTRRHFHSSQSNWRRDGKETRIRFTPNVDEGTKGEKLHEIDSILSE